MSDSSKQISEKTFRARFRDGDPLLGTVIKTPSAHAIEIFGDLGFDFVMLDGEHAPFDRAALDLTLLATRAAGVAGIVRVADATPTQILAALDIGATGVMVPHVASPAAAAAVAAACRYRGGRRGFANTTRAGRYGGAGIAEHVANSDATTTVIAMIEDPDALDQIDAIAAVEGIDGFFLGRGDLAVAMGEPAMDSPRVREATEKIAASARSGGKALCAFAASAADAEWLNGLGVMTLMISSDHGFMRAAASQALKTFSAVLAKAAG